MDHERRSTKGREVVKLPSGPFRAVIHIFDYNQWLRDKTFPWISADHEFIDWDGIFSEDYGSGHFSAVCWAKAIWSDFAPFEDKDLFSMAFSMEHDLKKRVLESLAMRWGLEAPYSFDKYK